MPAVDGDRDNLFLLNRVLPSGAAELLMLPRDLMVRIHDRFSGGQEVAYLHIERLAQAQYGRDAAQ
jgi:hypothetical protein